MSGDGADSAEPTFTAKSAADNKTDKNKLKIFMYI